MSNSPYPASPPPQPPPGWQPPSGGPPRPGPRPGYGPVPYPPPWPQYPQTGPAAPYGQAPWASHGQAPWASYGAPPDQAPAPYAQPGDQWGGQPATYQERQRHGGPVPYDRRAGASNLAIDYWLSAFFGILPALIFYLVDKDKDPLLDAHLKEVLNLALTRFVLWFVVIVPFVGALGAFAAMVVTFVVAIIGAAQGPDAYRRGEVYRYPLAIRFFS